MSRMHINDIKAQHKMLNKMKTRWHTNSLDSLKDIKDWVYELCMLAAFHFYTEELFLDVSQKDHIDEHRELLNLLIKILSMDEIENIQKSVAYFLDHYFNDHIEEFDSSTPFTETDGDESYVVDNTSHAGVVVMQFRNGFISGFYGELSGAVLGRYYDELEEYLPDMSTRWSKIVDLSRWELTTLASVDLAIKRNKTEKNIGCKKVVFYTTPNHLSKFIVEKIAATSKHITTCYDFKDLIHSDDFRSIIESKPENIKVIGSKDVIMNYYEKL